VSLLLMTPIKTRRLIEPLEALPAITLVRPFEDGLAPPDGIKRLTAPQASAIMRRLDDQSPFDLVVLPGFELICRVVDDGGFAGRLWPYLTDIPQSVEAMDAEHLARLSDIALASRFLLCQTEELRGFLEGLVSAACGRSVLFEPIVPVPDFAPPPPRQAPSRPVKLVYSGKFAPLWNTLPMTELPARLAELGIPAELHAIGEKVVVDRDDLPWRATMIQALRSTPGVTWHGGQSRQASMRLAADRDFRLGWRDRTMEVSLELSTKVLESQAVGLPERITQPTPMHEALLGVDYPVRRTRDEVIAGHRVGGRAPGGVCRGGSPVRRRSAALRRTGVRAAGRASVDRPSARASGSDVPGLYASSWPGTTCASSGPCSITCGPRRASRCVWTSGRTSPSTTKPRAWSSPPGPTS
jgi:hypothetical protein